LVSLLNEGWICCRACRLSATNGKYRVSTVWGIMMGIYLICN
jgi:hypothetical protein